MPYTTIEEIQLRKAMLLVEIHKDSNKLGNEWKSLFQKPDALNRKATPAKRFNSLLSTGAGMLDAAILGWKLYRKFKK